MIRKILKSLLNSRVWIWNCYISPKAAKIWKKSEEQFILTIITFIFLSVLYIILYGINLMYNGYIFQGLFYLIIILSIILSPFLIEHEATIIPWMIIFSTYFNTFGWVFVIYLKRKYPIRDPNKLKTLFFDENISDFDQPYRIKLNDILLEYNDDEYFHN